MGLKDVVAEEKLTLTASTLPPEGEPMRVVVLRAVKE